MDLANKLELHYYFGDSSHSMDAFTRNICEREILSIIKKASNILEVDLTIEIEAHHEGGLKDVVKFIGVNAVAITLAIQVVQVVMAVVPKSDSEYEDLKKEYTQLSIEEKKLQIEKLRKEAGEVNLNKGIIHRGAIDVESNIDILHHRSKFYEKLSTYEKVLNVGFSGLDSNNRPVVKERAVDRNGFKGFVLLTDDLPVEIDENAEIDIISPVLKKGRYKWKGIYKGEPINFYMHDGEFKNSVLREGVEFKSGTTIECVLQITRKIDSLGEISITGYTVTTVLKKIYNENVLETKQGKYYLASKKAAKDQGKLFGDE